MYHNTPEETINALIKQIDKLENHQSIQSNEINSLNCIQELEQTVSNLKRESNSNDPPKRKSSLPSATCDASNNKNNTHMF